jgi:hypothetical protein
MARAVDVPTALKVAFGVMISSPPRSPSAAGDFPGIHRSTTTKCPARRTKGFLGLAEAPA